MTQTAMLAPTAPTAPTAPPQPAELPPNVAWLVERAALEEETREALGAVADVPAGRRRRCA